MKCGHLQQSFVEYGKSVLQAPLRYIPCSCDCRLLVVAGIHGEEPETTFLLSRCLRNDNSHFNHIAIVLCANPDGVALGVRGNAHGVDLNRNFDTANWSSELVHCRSVLESQRDMVLSPGTSPASEPETKALVELIQKLGPKSILSIHAPIGCIDAPVETNLTRNLSKAFNLPYVADIGYKTPGSLGTWCSERNMECVTLELPRMALELLYQRYEKSFTSFLQQQDT